jgi:hypothetical protein
MVRLNRNLGYLNLTNRTAGLGVNIDYLFVNSASLMSGSTYLASLLYCIFLFGMYWTKFDIFQFMAYGSIGGCFTAAAGLWALSNNSKVS